MPLYYIILYNIIVSCNKTHPPHLPSPLSLSLIVTDETAVTYEAAVTGEAVVTGETGATAVADNAVVTD